MITVNLVTKCCLIGGAGAATGAGAYHIKESYFSNDKKLEDLAKNVGLVCKGNPTKTKGTVCTKNGTVNFKRDNTNIAVTSLENSGKITVYTTSSEEYKDGFKFVIEDGDISGSGENKKIEQFETYEIKEDGEDWKLIRKNNAKTEIKKALGLPEGTECDLPTTSEKTCTLTEEKLKAINFEGKTKEMELVDGATGATLSLKMKIMAAGDTERSQFPLDYKFELQSNKDINLGGDKYIKKGTNTEFKIKVTPASGGPKVLTLEKAWNVTELGKKVGLVCPVGDKKECTLNADNINVDNGNNKKHTGLTKGDNGDDKVVKYEENEGDHNQGFKFFVDGETDITLGGNNGGEEKKIKAKGTDTNNPVTYQILKESTGNTWYLTKKAAAAGA